MPKQYVTLVIDASYLDRLAELIERLERIGFQVDQLSRPTATISGSIAADKLAALEQIDGIQSIEPTPGMGQSDTSSSQGSTHAHDQTGETTQTIDASRATHLKEKERGAPNDQDQPSQEEAEAVSVTISVAEEFMDQFEEVIEQAEEVGLQVEQKLELLGIITGTVDMARIIDIRHIEGIADVEISRDYQIAPPDSDIQ